MATIKHRSFEASQLHYRYEKLFNKIKEGPVWTEKQQQHNHSFFTSLSLQIRSIFWVILPSYLQSALLPPSAQKPPPREIQKTTFLDGLRGIASLIVVIYHHVNMHPFYFQVPYVPLSMLETGSDQVSIDPLRVTHPLQLPIIRIIHSGPFMVLIFYLVGGYVVSFRAVHHMRAGNLSKFTENIGSSAFRRGFRLFIPSVVGLALFQFAIQMDWIREVAPEMSLGEYGVYTGLFYDVRALFEAVWDSYASNMWRLRQIWTVPREYTSSLLVFVTLMGIYRLTTQFRILIMIGLAWYSLWNYRFDCMLFLSGTILAEVEAVLESLPTMPRPSSISLSRVRSLLYYIFWLGNLFIALLIASWPEIGMEWDPSLPGYLYYNTPYIFHDMGPNAVRFFWGSFAAIQILLSLYAIPTLQRPFTSRFALYLGDISFALCLTHMHIVCGIGPWVHNKMNGLFGEMRENHWTQFIAVLIELTVILFAAFWEADLFWRWVDQPCIQFTKWLEGMMKA